MRVGWQTYACGAAAALLPSFGTAIFSNIRTAQRSSLRTFSNLSRMASRGSSVSRHSALSLLLSIIFLCILFSTCTNFPFSMSFLFLFSMVTKCSISPSFSRSMGAPPPPALTSPRIAGKSAVFALPVGNILGWLLVVFFHFRLSSFPLGFKPRPSKEYFILFCVCSISSCGMCREPNKF